MPKFVKTLRGVADYCERMEPMTAHSHSLQLERNGIITNIFDLLLANVAGLAQIGVLEPLQTLVSDLLENELENMDNMIGISANLAKMSGGIRDTIRE